MGCSNPRSNFRSERPKLLCIDDDPEISAAISMRMRQYEVEVLCAYHGMHGYWQAVTERPDLVITDLRMPQGAGDDIVECLKNNAATRHIPIVVLSGQRGTGVKRRMERLGVEEFLTKPVAFSELLEVIERFVVLRECEELSAV